MASKPPWLGGSWIPVRGQWLSGLFDWVAAGYLSGAMWLSGLLDWAVVRYVWDGCQLTFIRCQLDTCQDMWLSGLFDWVTAGYLSGASGCQGVSGLLVWVVVGYAWDGCQVTLIGRKLDMHEICCQDTFIGRLLNTCQGLVTFMQVSLLERCLDGNI